MKLLRIEFARERDDAFFGDLDCIRAELITDVQILEIEFAHALFSARSSICHAERSRSTSNFSEGCGRAAMQELDPHPALSLRERNSFSLREKVRMRAGAIDMRRADSIEFARYARVAQR